MAWMDLTLQLHVEGRASRADVRAWIDFDPDGDLYSESELPLRRLGRGKWIGTFCMDGESASTFYYRLGIAAPVGSQWCLTLRDQTRQRDVLVDGDLLGLPKCWLVGSWSQRVPAATRVEPQVELGECAGARRGARTRYPHLVRPPDSGATR